MEQQDETRRAGVPWHMTDAEVHDLAHAIIDFQSKLPGWWWSIGLCHVSADASCGPIRRASCAPDWASDDAWLLEMRVPGTDELFDAGFHCDARFDQAPRGSVAGSLRQVMNDALTAKAQATDYGAAAKMERTP